MSYEDSVDNLLVPERALAPTRRRGPRAEREVATSAQTYAVCLTLVAAVGAALDPAPARLALLVVVGLAAITVQLLAGSRARQEADLRHEAERLRAAVRAQMLLDQAQRVDRLCETVADLLERHHSLGNGLMTLQLTADRLRLRCDQSASTDEQVRALAGRMREGVARLSRYVEHMNDRDRDPAAADREVVDVRAVVETVCATVGSRFAGKRLRVVADSARPVSVSLRGGAATLSQVVENLLVNACEGDGTRGASEVEVALSHDPSGRLFRLIVRDDGPGFNADDLQRPIEGLRTHKRRATGLGLYTADRLVQANGGRLARANRATGGAAVTLTLPLAAAAIPTGAA